MTDNIKRDGAHVLVGTGRPLVSDFVPSGDMVSYPKDQTKCETIVTSWPCECAVRLARDGLRGNAPFTTDEADTLAKAVLEQHGEIERLNVLARCDHELNECAQLTIARLKSQLITTQRALRETGEIANMFIDRYSGFVPGFNTAEEHDIERLETLSLLVEEEKP